MNNYPNLLKKIDAYIRKFYLNKIIRGLLWLISIAFITFLIVIISEYFGYLKPTIKTLIFYTYLIIIALLSYVLVIRYVLLFYKLGKIINYQQASLLIGSHFPNVKDKLLNTLQLKNEFDTFGYNALLEASIEQKISELSLVPFVAAINFNSNKPYVKNFFFILGIFLIVFILNPRLVKDGTNRIIKHNQIFNKPAPFKFFLVNKSLSVQEGDDIILRLKTAGEILPNEVYINENYKIYKLEKTSISTFEYAFKNIQKSLTFRFQANDFYSKDYTIKVIPKAYIEKFTAHIVFPRYTNMKDKTIENPSNLQLPKGTKINYQIVANNAIYIDLKTNQQLKALKSYNHKNFTLEQLINTDKENSFRILNREVIHQKISCVNDLYPSIELNSDQDSTLSNIYYLSATVNDDYGISNVSLHYKILESAQQKRVGVHYKKNIPFKFSNGVSSIIYMWNTLNANLLKGEKAEYYLSATDNDAVNGPKTSFSAKKIVSLNSINQSQKVVENTTNEIQKEILKAKHTAKQLQDDSKKINTELLKNQKIDEDMKDKISSLVNKEQQFQHQLKEIEKLAQKNVLAQKNLESNNQQILEKQKELQNLAENLLDEKTKKLIEELKRLLNEKDNSKIKESLIKSPSQNKFLEKELDRLLSLYKELAFEQKLQHLTENLENLSKKESAISYKTKEGKKTIEEQKDLSKEFEKLKEEIERLQNQNKIDDLNKNLSPLNDENLNNIEKNLNDASNEIKSNDMAKASESQKQASEKMEQMASDLNSLQMSSESNENQVEESRLKLLIKNLLNTSFEQERLLNNLNTISIDNPQFSSIGKEQKKIGFNLKMYQDTLFNISKHVPQLQSAANREIATINSELSNAYLFFTERNKPEILKSQKTILTSINNLILTLNESLEALKNASKNAKSGKGKPNLQQLGQMQQQLNKNMQKAKQQLEQQGKNLGEKSKNQGISKLFSEMAQQQQAIREALENLEKSQKKEGMGGINDLGNTIKQMEQTENDLVYKKISDEILMRQKQIEIKLLESDKAQQEREKSPKRESEIPDNLSPILNRRLEDYKKNMLKDIEIYKTISPTLNYFYKQKLNYYYKNLNSKN